MNEALLNQTIEDLRVEMVRLASEKGSFLDKKVLALSQQLDQYLVKLERIKLNRYSAS
ncbi:aspartyl-phosphate phosphatase Spo0E family protein [Ammoniphilus resinae]|uniref:Aspartyl-phosphate phosphatase Spo0E family protein n=1 Tax=Ammoniphilus resinae TaxID=861532 RepID=A0ABS4GUL2_9BACL|nr:aspartyl-phosphate phosphatase Spo0E family protein [Ammoniphilus resinae]MBP1933961.1 hypothetical protein [Ammoniphilus resinae]